MAGVKLDSRKDIYRGEFFVFADDQPILLHQVQHWK